MITDVFNSSHKRTWSPTIRLGARQNARRTVAFLHKPRLVGLSPSNSTCRLGWLDLTSIGHTGNFPGFPGKRPLHGLSLSRRLYHAEQFNLDDFRHAGGGGFYGVLSEPSLCVPQPDTAVQLGGVGNRLMPRLAYRKFSDHDSVVGNYAVSANNVAGIRWFELRNVSSGPVTVFQESTYQPDTTWRWIGSAAMDRVGNLALGFSASSSTVYPSIRYTGRLASDPPNTLPQGEATLMSGGASQTGATSLGWKQLDER